jgi:Na+-driven multidrug efflux pump
MFFSTIYSIVDAAFVSNFVGKTSFAAVNLVMPVLMLIAAPGVMMGAGGSALVAKFLGEGDNEKANKAFGSSVKNTAIVDLVFMQNSTFKLWTRMSLRLVMR